MPTKKAAETVIAEPTPISAHRGYLPRPRFRTVTLDAIPVEDGAEPFTARIRAHLTFGQIDEIPVGAGTRYADLEEAIAPYVVEWNVLAVNAETGEVEPVPPPAVGGPDAFRTVSGFEVEWLAAQLRQTSFGDVEDEKKGSTSFAPTAEPSPAAV